MFRLALKQVRHNPKRLILTAIAVALGVSLVSATFTFTNSLSTNFSDLFTEVYGSTDVIVERDPHATSEDTTEDPFAAMRGMFSEDDVAAVNAVAGVDQAVGGVQVAGAVLPAELPTDPMAGGGGAPSQLFNWSGNPRIDLSTVVEGRGPEANGEIVLDRDSIPRLGYSIGDEVNVAVDGGLEQFTLVGAILFGETNSLSGATLGFFTTEDAKRLADDEKYLVINVVTDEDAQADAVATAISEVIPDGARAITGPDKAAEEIEQLDEVFTYINIFALVFALISLFVGGYLIVNTFRVIVTQRTREIGLLRAIGASGSQVRWMILLEALVVAIVASTLGIILGYLLALAAGALTVLVAGDILGTLVVPWTAILWSYVLGTLVTLVAALMPAIHAAQISPMEALRESATSGKKPLGLRNVVGAAMAVAGVAAVIVGLFVGVERPYIYVGAGAVLLVLGVTLLAAQVLVPMAYGMRGLLTKWFGVDGKLAANNIRREPRRSANTAAALMIGVMLLALVATFTESLKAVVTETFTRTESDLFVMATQGSIPQGALDLIGGIDGVEFVTGVGISGVGYQGEIRMAMVVDPEYIERVYVFDTEPSMTELDGGVFVGGPMRALGVQVGDTIRLTGPDGAVEVAVTGDYLLDDLDVVMDFELAGQLSDTVPIAQGFVSFADDADADATQAAVMEAMSTNYPTLLVMPPGALEQFSRAAVDMILGMISALLGAALFIAILGVANTLLLSVTERTREIGLLRAVGLQRKAIWRMITVESLVMAVFGTILGIVLGVSLGAALVTALKDFGFTGVAIPWVWMAVYTILSAIAGVLAAIWPAWRASRMDILQAIAADG